MTHKDKCLNWSGIYGGDREIQATIYPKRPLPVLPALPVKIFTGKAGRTGRGVQQGKIFPQEGKG